MTGIRGVSAIAIGSGSNASTSVFSASGELGAIVQLMSPIMLGTSSLSPIPASISTGLIDAVGNRFALLAYVKVFALRVFWAKLLGQVAL